MFALKINKAIKRSNELQMNKANPSDTEAPFLDLSITNSIGSTKIYEKMHDFNFEIVSFSIS